jgi:hypothetical protein
VLPRDIYIGDAVAGYLKELGAVRDTLDSRYDDLKSGQVKPIDGEEAWSRHSRRIDPIRRSTYGLEEAPHCTS